MSFIVEGLSIPKEGQLLSINIYPDGKVTYNLDLECKQIAVAKPVPTPHGELVDKRTMSNTLCEGLAPCEKDGGFKHPFDILRAVQKLPTVIEAEE